MKAVDITDAMQDGMANLTALKSAIRGSEELNPSEMEGLIHLVDNAREKFQTALSALESDRNGNGYHVTVYDRTDDTEVTPDGAPHGLSVFRESAPPIQPQPTRGPIMTYEQERKRIHEFMTTFSYQSNLEMRLEEGGEDKRTLKQIAEYWQARHDFIEFCAIFEELKVKLRGFLLSPNGKPKDDAWAYLVVASVLDYLTVEQEEGSPDFIVQLEMILKEFLKADPRPLPPSMERNPSTVFVAAVLYMQLKGTGHEDQEYISMMASYSFDAEGVSKKSEDIVMLFDVPRTVDEAGRGLGVFLHWLQGVNINLE